MPRCWIIPLLLCVTPALAQAPADRAATLDKLMASLKGASDTEEAVMLEQQIMHSLLQAGSPAVTLLMSRGLRELQANEDQEAITDFTDAITLDPNVAEAYHERAKARYAAGDTTGAIADIEQTLRQEPRDFAALRTLATIAEGRQDWKGAYAAWQKLMEIDPKTPDGEDHLKDLRRRALGEET
jgi:tetratricopeptide (TPR) repeat protein